MILVTVGMHSQPFDRLVRAADQFASLTDERVIIQHGTCSWVPRFARHVDYVDGAQMKSWLSECRVLVGHAGAGTVLNALQSGKPLVLVPRMADLREHIDDHQFELAKAMVDRGRAVVVTDPSAETLNDAIAQAERLGREDAMPETGLYAVLRSWLAEQDKRSPLMRWTPIRPKCREG